MKGNCGECERRWACEIDPNECNEWTDPAPMTNAQKIRAMSDEELAEFIKHIKVRAAFCKAVKDNDAFEALCSAEWLQQPAGEEDKHEPN